MRILKTSGAWLLAIALFLPTLAFAQNDGRFVGVVLDPSGAVIPGATVTVKNERTGEERSVMSNAEGRYVVTNLRPSIYTIQAKFGDLAPLEFTGLQLVAAQEFPLDLSLTAAGVTETVQVTANVSAVDLSSARIGVNVSEREINELPVNGRQMSQLMLQAPGSQNAGTGTWNDVRFSGRANNQNVIKFDGVEGSAIIDASPGNVGGQIASPFKLQASLENVQEFRVESNNYPAEFGTGTGGQVSVITKSGSNLFHGSFFEYYRDDALDAPNYFDSTRNPDGSVIQELPKSKLNQHQFGGSFGGPFARDRAFFFGSYEGYRLDAGVNFVEAAPSAAAWARAVPSIAVLRPGFTAPDAVLLPGASTSPDFDIYQLQGLENVRENAFSLRLDYRVTPLWTAYGRVFHDRGEQSRPEGISGRVARLEQKPTNAIFNLNGTTGGGLLNEFKIGYNAPKSTIVGDAPTVNGIDFSTIAINLTGSVANSGIAGQSASSGIVVPGGLIRANSATNGHGLIYDPFSLAFTDAVSIVGGNHLTKLGGEVRMIRMGTDQLGGTTYTFPNVTAFLANTPSAIQYARRHQRAERLQQRRDGHAEHPAGVLHAVRAGRVARHAEADAQLRPALRVLHAAQGRGRPDRQVQHRDRPDRSQHHPLHGSKKNNFQPRLSATYAVTPKTVLRSGFGVFVGPGQGEDLIQPIESDRVNTTLSTGPVLAYPINQELLVANFTNNPNNRNYQPRAYAQEYAIPERVYQYTASVQQELGGNFATTIGYVGSQGRNLFLRSVANQITQVVTNPNPASAAFVIREFSIVNRDAAGTITSVQNPYAEVDFKTSGGEDTYNALMLSLNRRASQGIAMNMQYTLRHQPRHVGRVERSEHRRQQRRARSNSSTTRTATTTSTCATRST